MQIHEWASEQIVLGPTKHVYSTCTAMHYGINVCTPRIGGAGAGLRSQLVHLFEPGVDRVID